jgi:hypothetical protein
MDAFWKTYTHHSLSTPTLGTVLCFIIEEAEVLKKSVI